MNWEDRSVLAASGQKQGQYHAGAVSEKGVDWNDRFSEDDKDIARYSGYPVYLISPNGELQRYTPEGAERVRRRTVTSPGILPHDANHPNLPWYHFSECENCIERKECDIQQ